MLVVMSVKNIVAKAQKAPGKPIYVDKSLADLISAECHGVLVPTFCTCPVTVGEPAKGVLAYFNGSPVIVGKEPEEPKAKPSKKDAAE